MDASLYSHLLQKVVCRMMDEIKEDMETGRLPHNVFSFVELHDFVDANEYGGFCDDDVANAYVSLFGGRDKDKGMPDEYITFIDEAQATTDTWLKNRRLH